MKKCKKCGTESELNECKVCKKNYNKEYYIRKKDIFKANSKNYNDSNKERISIQKREYYIDNKEKILSDRKEHRLKNIEKFKEKDKNYLINNRDKKNKYNCEYIKNRKENDHIFKLTTNLRNLISISIRKNGFIKKESTEDIIGCDFGYFIEYLESMFLQDMSWSNYGDWHIDHIIPVSYAENEDDIYKLNHYLNLQPLWAKDNLAKGNRFIG